MASQEVTLRDLESASTGFKHLLNDDVDGAKKLFMQGDSPFHLLGLGVINFLKAALGMEEGLMPDAVASLTAAEAGAKAAAKATRTAKGSAPSRYPAGTEYEICQAVAIVLLGLTQALSESYMGYLQCIRYSLNSAHGKFSKMYKQVFPHGLGSYGTPAQTPTVSRKPSATNLSVSTPASGLQTPASGTSSAASSMINGKTGSSTPIVPVSKPGGFFGRLAGKSTQSTPALLSASETSTIVPDGPIEELIVAGAAFGYGLFNLVFSLLPNKVKKVVGWMGYQSDRRLGLEALHVAAGVENDIRIPDLFSLVLMTYNGVVLLLTGWQADEERIVKQYREILDSVESKYPHGSLWLLNRAKLERMTLNASKAIEILKRGLSAERPVKFLQADALLLFELAWTLLADRQYKEAAEAFLKIKDMNSWYVYARELKRADPVCRSHATYTFIAAGCYLALAKGDPEYMTKARALFELIPKLLDRKKLGGRDLPTEVFIQKKSEHTECLYRAIVRQHFAPLLLVNRDAVHSRFLQAEAHEEGRTGCGERLRRLYFYLPRRSISGARCLTRLTRIEIAKVWNTHCRITNAIAQAQIADLVALSPTSASSEDIEGAELDTADEIAIRDLLLGILYRAAGDYPLSRKHLEAVTAKENDVEGKWTGQVSKFELAVLELREVAPGGTRDRWSAALKAASTHLDQAASRSNAGVDLSSRLDSRIALLRDEIEVKMQGLGLK
ncbi:Mitochondrial outer membrane protein IML2 [Ceratobasidium theobromae]|uniref:Mitochondrial outer membrane protein IML2 n=1 Tax=Ceratobasidium theobromae TaxID=1582974 RepID=A0A5N5QVZ6_9AGAM|nr:Mitochondrial outer membrane protein IML2 [Ceratobasidium theobromae]